MGLCIKWVKRIELKYYVIFACNVKSYDVVKELQAKIINDIKPSSALQQYG